MRRRHTCRLHLTPDEHKRAKFLAKEEGHRTIADKVCKAINDKIGSEDLFLNMNGLQDIDYPAEPITLSMGQMNKLYKLKKEGEPLDIRITEAQSRDIIGLFKNISIALSGEQKVTVNRLARTIKGTDSSQSINYVLKWAALHPTDTYTRNTELNTLSI